MVKGHPLNSVSPYTDTDKTYSDRVQGEVWSETRRMEKRIHPNHTTNRRFYNSLWHPHADPNVPKHFSDCESRGGSGFCYIYLHNGPSTPTPLRKVFLVRFVSRSTSFRGLNIFNPVPWKPTMPFRKSQRESVVFEDHRPDRTSILVSSRDKTRAVSDMMKGEVIRVLTDTRMLL